MKNIALALSLTLFTATVADAKPWYKDVKVWLALGATAFVTYKQSTSVDSCRLRAGIEHCYGGYGERNGLRALAIISQGTSAGLGLWMRHDEDKAWPLPFVVSNTVWGINAIRQAHRTCKTEIVAGQCED